MMDQPIEEFNLATAEKQDQILANMPKSTALDTLSYIPFYRNVTASDMKAMSSKTMEILNITGKGFVTDILISLPLMLYAEENIGTLSITVDEVLVFKGSLFTRTNDARYGGFSCPSSVENKLLGATYYLKPFGYVDGTPVSETHTLRLPTPIGFLSSLKVVVYSDSTSTNFSSGSAVVHGGLLK